MGSHRAERRPATRPRSDRRTQEYVGRRIAGRETPPTTSTPSTYVGRRAAQPESPAAPVLVAQIPPLTEGPVRRTPEAEAVAAALTTELPAVSGLTDSTAALSPAVPGKRRAVKGTTRTKRGPLRALPPLPVLAGVATLAIAVGGVVTTDGDLPQLTADSPRMSVPNAASGAFGSGTYDALGRNPVLSRDSERDALGDASGSDLQKEAEAQADQRNEALGTLAQQAEREAKNIKLNAWGLPVAAGAYQLTARFGECSYLWSRCHTGLDFAAPTGTPIQAVASGTVTSAGYAGAYGYQTIVTLDDGTEIWYCHQNEIAVSVGDQVTQGQVIGYVGSTGNVTGSHVHLEVRPGGGDPVDPYQALIAHSVQP